MMKIQNGTFVPLLDTNFKPYRDCEEVMNLYRIQAEGKNLDLTISESTIDAEKEFKGDSSRYKQILLNIIGNSIKYTTQGGISI
jgi:signal transduction histidine kinase